MERISGVPVGTARGVSKASHLPRSIVEFDASTDPPPRMALPEFFWCHKGPGSAMREEGHFVDVLLISHRPAHTTVSG